MGNYGSFGDSFNKIFCNEVEMRMLRRIKEISGKDVKLREAMSLAEEIAEKRGQKRELENAVILLFEHIGFNDNGGISDELYYKDKHMQWAFDKIRYLHSAISCNMPFKDRTVQEIKENIDKSGFQMDEKPKEEKE